MEDVREAADLWGVEPASFVAASDQLVKRLRAEGEREQAAVVAKMRRPPPTAWALNRVARDHPSLISALLAAGASLRTPMDAAVSGDASALRTAQAGDRSASDAVVDAAASYLGTATDQLRLRMIATLRVAIVDDGVADLLRRGELDADRDAPGFGLDPFSVQPGRPAPRPSRPARPPSRPAPTPPASPRRPAAAAARVEDQVAARATRIRKAELDRDADRLERKAERLEREAASAARRAEETRAAAESARRDAVAARRAASAS
jgi:hypothetical protein